MINNSTEDSQIKILSYVSWILRAIAFVATAASGILAAFFILSEPANEIHELLFICTLFLLGPLSTTVGIILSLFNKQRPAILRMETVFGFLLTYVTGLLGVFSIGGILIIGLFVSVTALFADSIIFRFTYYEKKKSKINILSKISIIVSQLVILILAAKEVVDIIYLVFPVFLIWNVLLYFSIQSYLPDQLRLFFVKIGIILILLLFLLFLNKSQPDFWANISFTSTSSGSSETGFSDSIVLDDGSIVSKNIDINFRGLNKHTTWLRFSFNGNVHRIKSSTRTVFYGLLNQKNTRFIILQLNDRSKIEGEVENQMFVVQSNKPQAEEKVKEIMLLNQDRKQILNEKIED